MKQWYQNNTRPKSAKKKHSSSKILFDFLIQGTIPRMPEWRMYGHIYNEEKVKPLAKQAYEAACREYDQLEQTDKDESDESAQTDKDESEQTDKGGSKKPQYVVYWTAVSQEEYAKETPDVKRIVVQAVEEHFKNGRILKDGPPPDADTDQKAARLGA